MEILQNRSNKITKQTYNKDVRYKISPYTIIRQYENYKIAFSSISYCCIVFDISEEKNLKEFFVENWFLTPENIDDYEIVSKIKKEISTKIVEKTNLDNLQRFTIYTTTDCNARCYYCFENDLTYVTDYMSLETANKLADFLITEYNTTKNRLMLIWYGGEPFLNEDVISVVCKKLNENNVNFESHFITNASLLTKEKVDKCKTEYNGVFFQISLDGVDEQYKKSKRYIIDDIDILNNILEIIDYIVEQNFKLEIRLNLGLKNLDELKALVDILANEHKGKRNIKVYGAPLYSLINSHPEEIRKYTEELGDYIKKVFYNDNRKQKFTLPNIATIKCTVDQNLTIGIRENGTVVACTRPGDSYVFGSIYTDKSEWDIENLKRIKQRTVSDSCKNCFTVLSCNLPYICGVGIKCTDKALELRKKDVETVVEKLFNKYIAKHNDSDTN